MSSHSCSFLCRYVIHTACPVLEDLPAAKGYTKCIQPCIQGVQNVLSAVEKSETVEKVIMTSSMAAVVDGEDPLMLGPGLKIVTEDSWAIHTTNYAYGMQVHECDGAFFCPYAHMYHFART